MADFYGLIDLIGLNVSNEKIYQSHGTYGFEIFWRTMMDYDSFSIGNPCDECWLSTRNDGYVVSSCRLFALKK